MESNGFAFVDPNKPRYMVCCEPWEEFPERVLVTEVLRGKRTETRGYVQERTCHLETNCHTCSRCSECGYHVWHVYNYCPSCGAKVVEE